MYNPLILLLHSKTFKQWFEKKDPNSSWGNIKRIVLSILVVLFLLGHTSAYAQFRTTWVTTDGQITIPTTGTGYNYDITWMNLDNAGVGDGSDTGVGDGNYTITGLTNGDTYQVEISGAFPRIYFNSVGEEVLKIRSIEQWGNISWSSMEGAFGGCSSLIIPATDAPDLSNVTDMSRMFAYASSFNQDISTWDVSTVSNMSKMFQGANAFNQDISDWNVSNVSNMSLMFQYANAFNNGGVALDWTSGFAVDANMSAMFLDASSFNQDISDWNTSNVTNMSKIFQGANAFNNGGVALDWTSGFGPNADLSFMFAFNTSFNQDISNWNTSNVTSMSYMLNGASAFNNGGVALDWTSGFGPNADLSYIFNSTTSFNQDISDWNTSNVTNMSYMLAGATAFNNGGVALDWASGFAIDANMYAMFADASSFNQDISDWNMSNVTNMAYMFNGASVFNNGGVALDWTSGFGLNADLSYMFAGVIAFNQDISDWNTSNVTNMSNMLSRASAFNNGGVALDWASGFGPNASLSALFQSATAFNQDISDWNTSNIADMSVMFFGATAFNNGGVALDWTSGFGPNVNLSALFATATAFNQDLSAWDLGNVTNMSSILYNATSFDQSLASWDISSVTTMNQMLTGSGMSAANYEATLNGWASGTIPTGITLGASATYCDNSGRNILTSAPNNWTITDGGRDCTPVVLNVTSNAANGTYSIGATLNITISFNRAVTVTGTPQLTLETGDIDQVIDYTGGTGTKDLTFSYTIQAGDESADLDYASTTALALNGGTIQNVYLENAVLTLPAPGEANSLGGNKALVIPSTIVWTGTAWSPAAPNSTDNVIIQGDRDMATYGDFSCAGIIIEAGVSVIMTEGNINVTGNWMNNGTFSQSGGTVTFEGAIAQSISGTNSFKNITINNTAGVTLSNPTTVTGRLVSQSGALGSGGNLTLASSQTGTAYVVDNGGTITGNVTVQRYTTDNTAQSWSSYNGPGYHHFSSPAISATVADFSGFTAEISQSTTFNSNWNQAVNPFPNFYFYDESRITNTDANTQSFNKGWLVPSAGTDVLVSGKGFTANIALNQTTSITGVLNDGNITTLVSRGNEVNSGWNLLGNPYASPLDFDAFRTTNSSIIDNAVYISIATAQYTNGWAAYVNGIGSPAGTIDNGHIAPMQGFFVRKTSNTPNAENVTFQDSHRVDGSFNFYRTQNEKEGLIRLQVAGGDKKDELVVYIQEGATESFDPNFDAYKPGYNPAGYPTLFAKAGEEMLSITGFSPDFGEQQIIPLGLWVERAGEHHFTIDEFKYFSEELDVLLEDRLSGDFFSLSEGTHYTFNADKGFQQERFFLHIQRKPLSIEAPSSSNIQVYGFDGTVYINAQSQIDLDNGLVAIYALDGRLVYQQELSGRTNHLTLPLGLKGGIYILKLQTAKLELSKKLKL